MSRFIKIPSSLFLLAKFCQKHKPLYIRVLDASDHFSVEEYPFIIQFRCADSSHWYDLNRYAFWSEARDAMMRIVDRYDNIFLE